MKIVVALDKFKGSLSAQRACELVRDAIREVRPEAEIILQPMADGGDGTAAVIHVARGGEWVHRHVTGPLSGVVAARYLWMSAPQLAVIEMASASGLVLMPVENRQPLLTTTYGTGELIRDAIARDARHVWLGVGGSATVDGGVGAAMAMGWKFLDRAGNPVGFGGGELPKIARIVAPDSSLTPPLSSLLEVLCDVDTPLIGSQGAAHLFAPQKGATPAMVAQLEAGLAHLADLVHEQLGRDCATLPGAGAAGGLGFGAAAFLNAGLVSGADKIMEITGLEAALAGADWVITGEGCFDEQSTRGKVVAGILRRARQHSVKVALLAGRITVPNPPGFAIARAITPENMPLAAALPRAAELLTAHARELAAGWKASRL